MDVCSSFLYNSQELEITQSSSVGEQLKKLWCTHVIKYYSAINRNQMLIYAATQMNPLDLSEKKNPKRLHII